MMIAEVQLVLDPAELSGSSALERQRILTKRRIRPPDLRSR
jgi:hypothetical protein